MMQIRIMRCARVMARMQWRGGSLLSRRAPAGRRRNPPYDMAPIAKPVGLVCAGRVPYPRDTAASIQGDAGRRSQPRERRREMNLNLRNIDGINRNHGPYVIFRFATGFGA